MTEEPAEMSTRDVRAHLADAVNRAIAGGTTYVTQNGRRVARIAPLKADAATPAPAAPPEQAEAEAALQKHRAGLDDFLRACMRAVTATPDSMLRSLKPYWPNGAPKRKR